MKTIVLISVNLHHVTKTMEDVWVARQDTMNHSVQLLVLTVVKTPSVIRQTETVHVDVKPVIRAHSVA